MAGEKKRRHLRRSRYVETLNQNQIPPTTPPQTTLVQPSISIDTDRNVDLDLRQTGSRSIDLIQIVKTDVALDLHNIHSALDLLHHHKKQIDPYGIDLYHRYRLHLTSDRQLLHLHRQLPQIMTIPTILWE